jgi:hypothetical protein
MLGKPQRRAISLAEVGQRVCFIENEEATPELSPRERAMTFVVKAVRGVGDDAFVKVETVDGEPYGWYPVTVFGPARAGEEKNPMTKATDTPKDATDAVMARVKQEANKHGIDLSMRLGDAVKKLAGPGDEALALSYRRQFTDGVVVEEQVTEPAPSVTLSLSATQATSFLNLVNDIKRERGINNEREAIHLAQQLRPDLAEAYAEGQF